MSDPKLDKPDELAGTEQPFVQHLMELRDRMIKAVIAIGVAAAVLAFSQGRARCTTCWPRRWWPHCPKAQH